MSFVTPRGFHLGKNDPTPSPFKPFREYFTEALPAPPNQAHYGLVASASFQMDANGPDPLVTIAPSGWAGCGDCVEACKTHALATGNFHEFGSTIPVPTPNAVVEQYCAYQNCTPAQLFSDPNTYDQGEDISTSLTQWCQGTEYGTKLPFTAPVDVNDIKSGKFDDLLNAIYLGGCAVIGIQLPQNAETEFPGTWTWDPSSPSLGGHCVLLTGYNVTEKMFWLVTWGALIGATFEFIQNTCDESHAIVFPQAIAAGKSPTGLLLPKWESDLADLNS